MQEEKRLKLIDHLITLGQDRTWAELGELYELSSESARKIWQRYRKSNSVNNLQESMEPQEDYTYSFDTNYSVPEFNVVSGEFSKPIATPEALMKELGIDPNTIIVKKFWSNRKEIKEKDGSVSALYKVTAEFVPKKDEKTAEDTFKQFVSEYTGLSVEAPRKETLLSEKDSNILILSLTDLHLDKKSYKEETGENGDTTTSYIRALDACYDLVDRASVMHNLTKIYIIGGNDFFHANSAANTTAKGTPLDVDGRWHQSFRDGLRLMTTIIDYCKQYADVEFINVNGNHGPERDFYLTVALEAFYRNDRSIKIDSIYTERKYFSFGTSAFLLGHDLTKRVNDLPVIFATERPDLFATSKYRTVLTGHFHKQKETHFISTNENYGIIYKILPSLSTTDKWHHDNTFIQNQKACIALVVNEKFGTIAELIYQD